MPERTTLSCSLITRLLACVLAVALAPRLADAYVVVTSDNRVYQVDSRPQLHGDLVLFQQGGQAVSLRIYDVNITKTNELNNLMDQGASSSAVQSQLRQLRPTVPSDERLIVSSRVDRIMEDEYSEEARLARREYTGSEDDGRDAPGPRRASRYTNEDGATVHERPARTFEGEARSAMDEAQRRMDSGDRTAPAPAASASPRQDARAADLDGEIAAEQDYLRKLTGGEVTVADLDGEIDRTMDKIKRLQKRRDSMGSSSADSGDSGRQPAGSREAKWESELQDAQAELDRLRGSQAGSSASGRDREVVDERIGELEWKINRLRKKIQGAE